MISLMSVTIKLRQEFRPFITGWNLVTRPQQKIPVREEELGLINAVSPVCEVFCVLVSAHTSAPIMSDVSQTWRKLTSRCRKILEGREAGHRS